MGWNRDDILSRKRPPVIPVIPDPKPKITIRFRGEIVLTIPNPAITVAEVEEPPTKKIKLSPSQSPRPLPLLSNHDEGVGTLRGLGVEEPTWILDKILTASDVSVDQNRLLLPSARVTETPLLGMMTAEERRMVNDKERGLPVRVVDGSGRRFEMVLKYLECNRSYRLIGQFSKFVAKNRVRAGHVIQMWGFRGGDGLGLALLITTPTRNPLSPTPTFAEREAAEALLLLKSSAR